MAPEQSPSSIPPKPKTARYVAWTSLIVAVAGLIGAHAHRIATTPTESAARAEPAPKPNDKPIPEPPNEPATTDEGVVAARLVRSQANAELIEHRARIAALESLVCDIKRELRLAEARRVRLETGKRGERAQAAFLRATAEWTRCPAVTNETPKADLRLGSLREAADEALLQR